MKRFFILAAIVAATVLCTAAFAFVLDDDSVPNGGTVRFESTHMPQLNFTMPVSRAADIFRLMPESVAGVCRQEYAAVRSKCCQADHFTYEGVNIRCAGADPALQFVFTVPGYKLTVSGVSWETLGRMFVTEP